MCKTCSNKTLTTTSTTITTKTVLPTGFHRPNPKQRKYQLLSRCMVQDRFTKLTSPWLFTKWPYFIVRDGSVLFLQQHPAGVTSVGRTSSTGRPIRCLHCVLQNATEGTVWTYSLYTYASTYTHDVWLPCAATRTMCSWTHYNVTWNGPLVTACNRWGAHSGVSDVQVLWDVTLCRWVASGRIGVLVSLPLNLEEERHSPDGWILFSFTRPLP